MRECGLKPDIRDNSRYSFCHSLCGSVDWNDKAAQDALPEHSHSLCGSVDWNHEDKGRFQPGHCHSLCGSVDWNAMQAMLNNAYLSHSLCGSVDWNRAASYVCRKAIVTPYARVWIETSNRCALSHNFSHSPYTELWIEIRFYIPLTLVYQLSLLYRKWWLIHSL